MLTPLDIENKRFKKEVFGYNQIEVEDFLSTVSAEYEKVFKDNAAALARIGMLTDAIKQYKSMEETLQNAMTIAQKSGDEIRTEAKEAAVRLVANAEEQAQNLIANARQKAAEISYKAEEIKMTSELFKKQTIELLNEQLGVLKKRHSIAVPETAAVAEYVAAVEEAAGQSPAANSNEPTSVDLSKILADVGKISQSIDEFTAGEDALADIENVQLGDLVEFDDEPQGVRELFEN